jgi:uncharacterized protein YbaR (Trm112 family)
MRVELIELLRCPSPHETSPLVTVAERREGEHLLNATLGCVVCGASYLLRVGVLDLSTAGTVRETNPATVTQTSELAHADDPHDAESDVDSSPDSSADDEAEAMRVAALLNIGDATSRALLCGRRLHVARAIEALTSAQVASLNPRRAATGGDRLDVIRLVPAERIPLADRCLSGIAVDLQHVAMLDDATRVVRPGGRILAPVTATVPEGCRELARDDVEWVAEVEALVSNPIRLTRAS